VDVGFLIVDGKNVGDLDELLCVGRRVVGSCVEGNFGRREGDTVGDLIGRTEGVFDDTLDGDIVTIADGKTEGAFEGEGVGGLDAL
jgi:hypothetical protein